MNILQKELHKKEVKARKLLAKKREGNFYIQVDNKSKNGATYKEIIPLHTFGKLPLQGFKHRSWEYLVNKANEKLGK